MWISNKYVIIYAINKPSKQFLTKNNFSAQLLKWSQFITVIPAIGQTSLAPLFPPTAPKSIERSPFLPKNSQSECLKTCQSIILSKQMGDPQCLSISSKIRSSVSNVPLKRRRSILIGMAPPAFSARRGLEASLQPSKSFYSQAYWLQL